MRAPTFIEIWNDYDWFNYYQDFAPVHTREYYKFRSVVRMALWIPFFTICVYIIIAAVSVFS